MLKKITLWPKQQRHKKHKDDGLGKKAPLCRKKKKQSESATSIVALLSRTSTLRHLVVLDDLPRSNGAKVAGRGIV